MKKFFYWCICVFNLVMWQQLHAQITVIKNVTVIDGTGNLPRENMDLFIKGSNIAAITPTRKIYPENHLIIDLTGKTVMPMLINTHGHIGLLKGTKTSALNYTKENIVSQLEKYEKFGVGTMMSLGTDREIIFGLRDSSKAGKLSGAYLFTAGYGFTTKGGGPTTEGGKDLFFRPTSPEEARINVKTLARLKPDMIKIWVDNFGSDVEKIKPEVYQAIINEAHLHHIRVASHLYYLEDAKALVKAGVDVFAHSVRDTEIDADLIASMKNKGTIYIPTLSLDKYAYAYAETPTWINDDFFRVSLEPGVLAMINNEEYRQKTLNSPSYQRNVKAFQNAMKNVKKLFDAGILIALGTDSGAQPIRTQGFSEHLELELLTDAGLTPLQAITVGTQNGAKVLGINKDRGTLEVGKKADFIILQANPADNIKATRLIEEVWKNGKLLNKGPLK